MRGKKRTQKFQVGDKVVFLGTKKSAYGHNGELDKFIGDIVTITEEYYKSSRMSSGPQAYKMAESGVFWCDEGCFDFAPVDDLPEFEPSEIETLLDLFA